MKSRMGRGLWAASLVTTLVAAGGSPARMPAVEAVSATYDFYLGGIWAGEMTFDGRFSGGAYRTTVTARTAGIVGLFFKAGAEAEAVGRINGDGFAPERFTADAYERRRRQKVDIRYESGTQASILAEPPYRIRPWSDPSPDYPGIPDPISAAFQAFTPGGAEEICGRTANVFDGQRRWAVEIGPPQEPGADGRIRCEAVYVRIAGFKPKLMGERARRPFALFLEAREDGLYQVIRVIGDTSFGLAVLLLRD
jgi:hypothetical protein